MKFVKQPSDTAAKAIIAAVQVDLGDKSNDQVRVTLVGKGGTLSGVTTKLALGGIATFDDLHIDVPGHYHINVEHIGKANCKSVSFNVK